MPGRVYLVGAGPGDPGLLTVKGLRCLESAQVVVYDRLLDPSLLQAAPDSAERVFVGKERGRQALTQEQINQVLVDRALAGLDVVRLKGGDPFVFGRGGEEALALIEHGITFEIVPGVTSPIGAAAYAGIPITHRGIATTFTVISGSEDPSKPESTVSWEALARVGGTLVVLMGWAGLESILATLHRHGMPEDTPVALVHWGTWPRQVAVTGRLDNILARGREAGLEPPVIAVIGKVVELREQLRWFDRRPLFGKRVLITRSRTQASRLRGLLADLGAQPVELATIQTAPLDDYAELDATLARLGDFRWVFFASINAVEAVFGRLERGETRRDARAFGNALIGAIGPATAEALLRHGLIADFVPARSVSEAVLEELSGRDWTTVPVFLPTADIGRNALARGLAGFGARVERVAAYRTVTPENIGALAREALDQRLDVVTFTSSSTVRNLLEALDGDGSGLKSSIIACIGPTTAATARELGLHVDLVAERHTVEGLVEALVQHFGSGFSAG
ncbi:MAG: uroporphyrinogen-III C-methyltransferase [Dehalococcoidia bacterium]|jgi:uroporphyrinogen III methyltransferase/synthase|nr:uroporphyrinogen-III C-methyltransferase [Dehalococcoidia bacterium]